MSLESVLNDIKILHRKEDEAIINEVFHEDCYKVDQLPEEALVIDIGAHIGTFSLRCAKEKGCVVYAYEPYLPSFLILVENINENHLENRIKAFNLAIAGCRKPRTFYFTPHSLGGNTLYKPVDVMVDELEVNCVTLKDAFLNNDLTECDVLKIDCEGAEKEIFCDEFKTYLGQASLILLEWHNYDGAFYAEYLKKMGYLVSITGCGCPPPPYDPTFGRGMLFARQY